MLTPRMAWAFTRILQQKVIPNTDRVRRRSFSPRFFIVSTQHGLYPNMQFIKQAISTHMRSTKPYGWPYATCILFISAVILVTVFSCCSWLYPTNPWDDANVFMTIGKSMKHGMKLYLDVFDHKGPCLFIVHQLACHISENSFLGIYLLEILCFWGFLVYSHRIMRLFTENPVTLPLIVLTGLLFIASDFFWFGDSVEELSLPILSYSLYLMLRFIKTGSSPKVWQSILMGIGVGLILWMKFTLLVFYAGALVGLMIVSYRKKQLTALNKVVLYVFVGISITTATVFAYFTYHGTLMEMLDAYFYTNLFLYNGASNNGEPTGIVFKTLKIAACAILTLPVALLKVRWDIKLTVVLAYALQLLSYALFPVHIYYFIPLFVYSPLIVYFIRNHKTTWTTYLTFAVVATISVATNFNIVTLINGSFPCSVTECARIVNSDASPSKKVMTFFSKDTGIYLLTDQLPPNPHFFLPNITIPEIKSEQVDVVAKGDIKYLIQKDYMNAILSQYYNTEIPTGYELVLQKRELYRFHFLINPRMHLWNLGYTQKWLKHIMKPDKDYQTFYLYRKATTE